MVVAATHRVSVSVADFVKDIKANIAKRFEKLQAEEDYQAGLRFKKSNMMQPALSNWSKAAHAGHVSSFIEIIEYYMTMNEFGYAKAFVQRVS